MFLSIWNLSFRGEGEEGRRAPFHQIEWMDIPGNLAGEGAENKASAIDETPLCPKCLDWSQEGG